MAKKKRNPKKPVQVWKFYKAESGKVSRSHKTCPKCGTSSFLANHKDRETCGKCHYTNFKK